jgi:hypothetical protein
METNSSPVIDGAKRLLLPLIPPDLPNKGEKMDKDSIGQSWAIVMPVT